MSRDFNGIDKRDLDNYITGHYGEDQFRDKSRRDSYRLINFGMKITFSERKFLEKKARKLHLSLSSFVRLRLFYDMKEK
jgi:hypothetical protein